MTHITVWGTYVFHQNAHEVHVFLTDTCDSSMTQCDKQRDKKSITKFTKEKALSEMELIDTANSAVILDHSTK